eukprot:gene5537-9359_t
MIIEAKINELESEFKKLQIKGQEIAKEKETILLLQKRYDLMKQDCSSFKKFEVYLYIRDSFKMKRIDFLENIFDTNYSNYELGTDKVGYDIEFVQNLILKKVFLYLLDELKGSIEIVGENKDLLFKKELKKSDLDEWKKVGVELKFSKNQSIYVLLCGARYYYARYCSTTTNTNLMIFKV